MAHHKRGKPQSARAGCKLCKPWKKNGCRNEKYHLTRQELRARVSDREQRGGW